jgi:hypothetical protein
MNKLILPNLKMKQTSSLASSEFVGLWQHLSQVGYNISVRWDKKFSPLLRGKKLFAAGLQIYKFTVLSYFLQSDPLPNIYFPYFDVRKWA